MTFVEAVSKIGTYRSLGDCADSYLYKRGLFISANMESLVNDTILEILSDESIDSHFYPDGVGSTLATYLINDKQSSKVPGCELWLSVLSKRQNASQCKVALLGAEKVVIDEVRKELLIRFPNISIVYCRDGFGFDQDSEVSRIIASDPDFVFIGLGQPKQELLGAALLKTNPDLAVFGLGGSFDVFVGKVNRAPSIMIRLKLEWLYRLFLQPSRLKRLIKPSLTFAKRLLLAKKQKI